MIGSFRDAWLQDFFLNNIRSKHIPSGLENSLFRKLQLINFANNDGDLRTSPGNHFEKLEGSIEGYCSIRVNKKWRLIFQWERNRAEAFNIYLDDHGYK